MEQQLKITNVYVFQNGMVVVFDQNGQQMGDYQGYMSDVLPKIMETGYTGPIERREWP